MIRKSHGGYDVVGKSGRKFGHYQSLRAAEHRLKQIEYFKYLEKHGKKGRTK